MTTPLITRKLPPKLQDAFNRSSPAGMTWFPFLGDPGSHLVTWPPGAVDPGHHHQDLWRSPGRLADAALVRPPVAAPAAWPEARCLGGVHEGPGWGQAGLAAGYMEIFLASYVGI